MNYQCRRCDGYFIELSQIDSLWYVCSKRCGMHEMLPPAESWTEFRALGISIIWRNETGECWYIVEGNKSATAATLPMNMSLERLEKLMVLI